MSRANAVRTARAPKRQERRDADGTLILSGAVPVRTQAYDDAFYRSLDPGISFAVRVLQAHGLHTCQSCQGGKGHSYPEPTVDLRSGGDRDAEGFAALAALAAYGLPVTSVALLWNVRDGLPYERIWRITFARTLEERAGERPTFIWGCQAR